MIWRAVIFDLDDTLYPERKYVISGLAAVARWAEHRFGISAAQSNCELRLLYNQGARGNIFDRWLVRRELKPELFVGEMVDAYRSHRPCLQPYVGTLGLLSMLRRFVHVGLVSDGYLQVQQNKLAGLGIAAQFDAVVFSDALGRDAWKPSPKPFLAVCQQLQTACEAAVYVGDNPRKDFLGARRAGMTSIRLRHGNGEYDCLEPETDDHAPNYVVTSLTELQELLSTSKTIDVSNRSIRSVIPKVPILSSHSVHEN